MSESFKDHYLYLGPFHTQCPYIACIGKLWGSGGLCDILVDSGVYAAATVDQILMGKQYNRATRALCLSYEAFMHVFMTQLINWLNDRESWEQIPKEVWTQLIEAHKSFQSGNDMNPVTAMKELEDLIEAHVMPLIQEFHEWGCSKSPTFKYWDECLTALRILLDSIRSDKEGNWPLHKNTQKQMIQYFFAANHFNYGRWASVHILLMEHLPQKIVDSFEEGQFLIKQKPGKFNGIAGDMGTDKTVIKDSKGKFGLLGINRQKAAIVRSSLSRHILGQYTRAMKEFAATAEEKNVRRH